MKALFYFYSAFNGTMLGILLDEAKKLIKEKNAHVYFIMCEGYLDMCLANPTGKKSVCAVCKRHSLNVIKSTLGQKCSILHLRNYHATDTSNVFSYNDVEDLKKIEYRGVKIGYASLSTYVHLTRNHQPKMDDKAKRYFDALLAQAARLTDAYQNILNEIQPDLVGTYNGRFNEFRPVYETTLRNNIEINMYEVVRLQDHRFFKVVFNNMLPHNVKGNLWRVDECWDNPQLAEGENKIVARSFFERRRSGQVAGDKVYVGNMKKGELPENWDADKNNIAIFNSSEDEFVAIGDEYSSLSLFKSQMEGLISIFEHFKDNQDLHFYLRIHPNLGKIQYKYHTELYDFEKKYSNVTVIAPESSINSYDLMDVAEKVIVFGSTMGLEAAYWKKPVILLNCAFYYYADICYIPQTEQELYDLIPQYLEPKENENILKYGLYYIDKTPIIIDKKEQFKYVDFNPFSIPVMGRPLYGFNYQKWMGSKKLSAISIGTQRLIAEKVSKGRFEMPVEDE
jgi:hypothetical protein